MNLARYSVVSRGRNVPQNILDGRLSRPSSRSLIFEHEPSSPTVRTARVSIDSVLFIVWDFCYCCFRLYDSALSAAVGFRQ